MQATSDNIIDQPQEITDLMNGDHSFSSLWKYILETKAPLSSSALSFGILTPVAILSTWPFIVSSWEYGQENGGIPMAIMQLIGGTAGAALIVYNIGGHYLGLLQAAQDNLRYLKKHNLIEHVEFKEYNNILKKCGRILLQYSKGAVDKIQRTKLDVLILAAITATCLAATALFYKASDKIPDWVLWVKAGVTFTVYSLIHTLPVSLILNVPWLNFLLIKLPLSPITIPVNGISWACSSKEKIERNKEQQLLSQQQNALRQQVEGSLYSLINRMRQYGFDRNVCSFRPKLPEGLPNNLQTLSEEEQMQMLLKMNALYNPPHSSAVSNSSTFWNCCSYIDAGLRNLFGLSGAALVGGSLGGYMKVSYDLYYELLGDSVIGGISLMVPTLVATEVLTIYFGWLAFAGAYDFLSKWLICKPQVPYAIKLNPLVSSFFLLTTWTVACFGYGTALQLVKDTFDPEVCGEVVYELLAICAKYGIIVYGLINFAQLVEKMIEPLVKNCGSKEQRQYLFLLGALKRLASLLDELNPKLLQEILNTIQNPEILKTLGLEKKIGKQTVSLIQPPKPSVTKSSWVNWLSCGFFGNSKNNSTGEERQPLIVNVDLMANATVT